MFDSVFIDYNKDYNYEQLISISLYLRDHLCNKIDIEKDKTKFMNLTIKVIKNIYSNKLDKNIKKMIELI